MNIWNDISLKPDHMVQQQHQPQAQQTDQNDFPNHLNQQVLTPGMIMNQKQAINLLGSNNNLTNLNNSNYDMENNGENDDSMDNSDDDCNSSVNDAEGVWSPDIEQSFQEALAIYPPCGRRKIILSEEGKMYGRNELIARYIKVRTGKTRSRKQVSSHIQVLAKRKTKDFHNHIKDNKDVKFSNGAFQNPFSNLTSAQIISPQPIIPISSQQQNLVVPSPSTIISNSNNPKQNTLTNNQNSNRPNNNNNNNNNNTNQQFMQNQPQQAQRALNQTNNIQPAHPKILQNCINLNTNNISMNNSNNNLHQQNGNNLIWPHPGIQNGPEKQNQIPSCSSQPEDLLQENIRINHSHSHQLNHLQHQSSNQQLSPDSSPNTNQQLWSLYNNNLTNNLNTTSHNKSVIGLNQLRLIEYSGFLEQRRDPDIYNKHLFLHLNTNDFLQNSENEDFESINYKEFLDKFPENDLNLSMQNQEKSSSSSCYMIKYWVDLNYLIEDNASLLYAVTNVFESAEPLNISCSTKVCSFGSQVVEKIENEYAQYEAGKYIYRFENSPMCEYMITFINKLKQLPDTDLKNSVLENFSVLQIIKNHDTKEILLTLAYVFEISTSEHGAQHIIYRLTNK